MLNAVLFFFFFFGKAKAMAFTFKQSNQYLLIQKWHLRKL